MSSFQAGLLIFFVFGIAAAIGDGLKAMNRRLDALIQIMADIRDDGRGGPRR